LIGEGISPKEAGRHARRAFGNRTLVEEQSREVWQWSTLETTWSDVRLAIRQLRRSPSFTIAAVGTLALAMFLPALQRPTRLTCLVVRSNRDPQQLGPDIRKRIRNLDLGLPMSREMVGPLSSGQQILG